MFQDSNKIALASLALGVIFFIIAFTFTLSVSLFIMSILALSISAIVLKAGDWIIPSVLCDWNGKDL